jgi:cytochrome c oxidase subunit IV
MTTQEQAGFTQGLAGQASPLPTSDHDDVAQHVRRYLYVFYALLFGTLITVGASYIPFGNHAINIAVALMIACAKASLVAGFFMHLISERKMIYGLLAFTAFFFLGLMLLTVGAFADFPSLTVTH